MLPLQGARGSVSGWGAEILHAAWHGQKKTRFRVLVKCRFLISKSGVEPEILHILQAPG